MISSNSALLDPSEIQDGENITLLGFDIQNMTNNESEF